MRPIKRAEQRLQKMLNRRQYLSCIKWGLVRNAKVVATRVKFRPPIVEVDREYRNAIGTAVFSAVGITCQIKFVKLEDGSTKRFCLMHEKGPFNWHEERIQHDTPTLPPGDPLPWYPAERS